MTQSFSIRTFIIAAVLFASAPFMVSANNDCSFNRTLSVGDDGEDVRCLQVFLNNAGYKVASAGVGSPGRETTTYGTLTEAAVLEWQKAVGVTGANGNFGPGSQSAYSSQDTASLVVSGSSDENLNRMVEELQQQLALGLAAASESGIPVPQVAGVSDSTVTTADAATDALIELVEDVRDLDEELGEEGDSNISGDVHDIRLNLYSGILKFFTKEYSAVVRLAEALIDDVENVQDELEESVEEERAEDALDDMWDEYDEADEEVDEAEDRDDSGADDARDLLKEARDLLREANDEMDEEEYGEVLDLVDEAEELIEEALDEL